LAAFRSAKGSAFAGAKADIPAKREAHVNLTREFLAAHHEITRRYFLAAGAAGAAAAAFPPIGRGDDSPPALAGAIASLEPFFTPQEDFRDVSRGKPLPHSLSEEKKREVGLTRESWRLQVISDPANPAKLGRELTSQAGTALDFAALVKLGEKHAVRFAKVMTCLNIGCPLGMGVWEGVPLREVLWLTRPREDVRRVFYYGFHNDDPKQLFQSSLPLGRVLEDYFDLPPVILCYKLNGQWLDSRRGGPVRIVVPESYGFKSIKWLSHVVLTNLPHANDTYANGNNDVDSPLKSFAATLSAPTEVMAGQPIPVTGYAQVGISGVSKVQVWMTPSDREWPVEDRYFVTAPWTDATILPPPARWGGELPDGEIPAGTLGFNAVGRPEKWPLPLGKLHWAAWLPGLPAGEYTLRSRTIDEKRIAQPLPRPFRKSGHAAIEAVSIRVKAA
jgi:DMSO/TMAO reductase YedYZ molybdopterin-dependent catalytic subunit